MHASITFSLLLNMLGANDPDLYDSQGQPSMLARACYDELKGSGYLYQAQIARWVATMASLAD
tara:strand:- start:558 stop:746 length:189 start_codon:yes stop_codon:yes gene_type:complete